MAILCSVSQFVGKSYIAWTYPSSPEGLTESLKSGLFTCLPSASSNHENTIWVRGNGQVHNDPPKLPYFCKTQSSHRSACGPTPWSHYKTLSPQEAKQNLALLGGGTRRGSYQRVKKIAKENKSYMYIKHSIHNRTASFTAMVTVCTE